MDFISCMMNHATVRSLPLATAYWVCAYANNQHELGADLSNDPMKSSFAKAMRIAHGVLLILDEGVSYTDELEFKDKSPFV